MEKLRSPYTTNTLGLSTEFYTKRKVDTLWEKVDEIVDWINEEKDVKENQNEVDSEDAIDESIRSVWGKNVKIVRPGETIILGDEKIIVKKIKPEPVENPDLTKLKEIINKYVESVLDGTSSEENSARINQYHIFGAAMKAICGENIFEWIRDNE